MPRVLGQEEEEEPEPEPEPGRREERVPEELEGLELLVSYPGLRVEAGRLYAIGGACHYNRAILYGESVLVALCFCLTPVSPPGALEWVLPQQVFRPRRV
jgi:hypothetical protein